MSFALVFRLQLVVKHRSWTTWTKSRILNVFHIFGNDLTQEFSFFDKDVRGLDPGELRVVCGSRLLS